MKFKTLRKKIGTQEDLAYLLDLSQNTISYWESGKAYPRRNTLKQLAELFGISEGEVLESIDNSKYQNR